MRETGIFYGSAAKTRRVYCSGLAAFLLLFMSQVLWGDNGIVIRPEALLKTGPVPERPSAWVLPNGRIITPLGVQVQVENLPLAIVVSPDERFLIASHTSRGTQYLSVMDIQSREVIQRHSERSLFLGLRISVDGQTVYASGGAQNQVLVFDFSAGRLTLRDRWAVTDFPAGLSLSPAGDVLYVVSQLGHRMTAIQTSTGTVLGMIPTGKDPMTVAIHPSGDKAYVACQRESQVWVFDVANPEQMGLLAKVNVQKNPEALAVSDDGLRVYAANADEDSVSVIDASSHQVVKTIDLRPQSEAAYGSSPNALAFSPSGDLLYVAQASDNKLSVLSLPEGEVLGAIPTGWYPTAVVVSRSGDTIFVANGKGIGTGTTRLTNVSTLQFIPTPGLEDLERLTQWVEENNSLPGRLFDIDKARFNNPVPLYRGGASPIKHVLFVVRENKTYDALLGDFPGGDGDPRNCLYCGDPTPNLRALVERFGSGDNYYSNAEVSTQGHEITTSATVNTFVEKLWTSPDRDARLELDMVFNPSSYPKKDFIFQNARRQGVSFRVYGEAVGTGKDLLIFDPRYVHWGLHDPPVFWLISRDVDKLDERIREWDSGLFPSLIYMLFPNDHTYGCRFPFPVPISMIADNDLATGRLIDWLSHSPYWNETLVFIIEDDPQQGRDHVDAHRSIMLAVSPWVKRGYVSHVHYSEAAIHATIQHILGLPPLTVYDEIAQPMWDIFTPTPDFTPFTALPRRIPEETCPPGHAFAQASNAMNFIDPDEAEGLQDLLWEYEKQVRQPPSQSDGLTAEERATPWRWLKVFTELLKLKPASKVSSQ
ncbi:MAG: bifunctional YncE family protein/alkaline phosphatase family protein [Acidobacteria bacterium]|nr:bifunctional YncE family protein/alkaline phosphatase family protein [Acidobacteriota bacterium]MBI3658155.1 bifunctional YncE family protein/alkaline phosphatase family protein [Acidobacteriota bacterium]